MLVDERGRAGQRPPRGDEIEGAVGHLHPLSCIAVDAPGDAATCDGVGRLGDPQRRRGVEQAREQVPLDVRHRIAGDEAAADVRLRQRNALEGDGVAPRRPHPQRIPVVVDDDTRRVGGDHRVRVPLDALGIAVGHRHVERGRGRRHRAEELAAVDPPTRGGAAGDRRRAGEVLSGLADRRGEHDAVACDLRERCGEGAPAAVVSGGHGDLAPALHVGHRDQMHVHADRDGRVAPRQATRRDDEVVRGADAEPADVDGDGRREVVGGLERVDRLEREGPVAIVPWGVRGQRLGEPLGGRHEAAAGVGAGCELDRHARLSGSRRASRSARRW